MFRAQGSIYRNHSKEPSKAGLVGYRDCGSAMFLSAAQRSSHQPCVDTVATIANDTYT